MKTITVLTLSMIVWFALTIGGAFVVYGAEKCLCGCEIVGCLCGMKPA